MNRVGVLYVLRKLKISATLPRGKNIQISCPLSPWRRAHLKGWDNKPSMGVSISDMEDSFVHCFTCKWRGKLENLVEQLYQFGALTDELAMHLGSFIMDAEQVPIEDLLDAVGQYDVRHEAQEDEVFDDTVLEPFARRTHKYLLDRGLTIETIKAWEGGFDKEQKRVLFPVRNWKSELVGLVGRGVHEGIIPTYKNYWKFPKGRYIYGENKVVPGTTMVIVEGPLDVQMVWQQMVKEGLLNDYSVGGLFGSDATLVQIRKIVRFASDVILFLDNDTAGWDSQKRLGRALQSRLLVREVKYSDPSGGDPDELIRSGQPLLPLFDESPLFVIQD